MSKVDKNIPTSDKPTGTGEVPVEKDIICTEKTGTTDVVKEEEKDKTSLLLVPQGTTWPDVTLHFLQIFKFTKVFLNEYLIIAFFIYIIGMISGFISSLYNLMLSTFIIIILYCIMRFIKRPHKVENTLKE